MNRSLTSLFAAFEALLVVAIGIGIPLAPLTVLWGVQYGFALDWWAFWRGAVDIWLVGHGTDLALVLDEVTAAGLGVEGAAAPFAITIAVLGFALLTAVLGTRAGRRIAQTNFRLMGGLVALGVFAALSFGATISAQHPLASPSLVQGILLPTGVFGLGLAIGIFRTSPAVTDVATSTLRGWISEWNPRLRAAVATALRGGAMAAFGVVAVSAVVVAALIFGNFAQIITLYEGLHAGALGGLALTIAQAAFLPNLVMWGMSWLVGPGFAIGVGSSVSPLATSLGPIPAVPILGALPAGDSSFGFVGLLVPIVIGFLAGALLRPRLLVKGETPASALSLLRVIPAGLGIGVAGGALLGLLAWSSSGSAGPGRLVTVGPDPLQVGLWAALEIGLPAALGLYAAAHLPKLRSVAGLVPGVATSGASATPSAAPSATASPVKRASEPEPVTEPIAVTPAESSVTSSTTATARATDEATDEASADNSSTDDEHVPLSDLVRNLARKVSGREPRENPHDDLPTQDFGQR